MPLSIVDKNIDKIKCDAKVVLSDTTGVTPSDGKYCKFIINAVSSADFKLKYTERMAHYYYYCLVTAMESGYESVAIPILKIDDFYYPMYKQLKYAVKLICRFLADNEIDVYLVVKNKSDYKSKSTLITKISRYIGRNSPDYNVMSIKAPDEFAFEGVVRCKPLYDSLSDIEIILSGIDDSFSLMLMKLIDAKKMTDVECYKRANVSKQTWYKILNDKNYRPSKNTVIAFAIALNLSYDETQHLLSTVGFTLSKSSEFDLIIEYLINQGCYDIMKINEILFEFDQPCLGV
ncbi:MAG: hypothetical protein J6N93_02125 [Clostridia bacterium]|nr:hypothetical protein [Clostridia bacterium]